MRGGSLESRLPSMHKFKIIFATHAVDHPLEMLFTYAASRRAAVTWAADWAARRGWEMASVEMARPQKQPAFPRSAREQVRRP